MFHVKRDPIEVTATLIGCPADKVVHIGVDYLQRQRRSQAGRTAAICTVNTNLQAGSAVTYADAGAGAIVIYLPKKNELLFAVPDQAVCRRPAKGFTAPEIGDRLQNARLARGVRAVDQIESGVRFELNGRQAAKIRRRKFANRHSVSPAPLEAHRHNNKLTVVSPRLTNQAAGIAIQNR